MFFKTDLTGTNPAGGKCRCRRTVFQFLLSLGILAAVSLAGCAPASSIVLVQDGQSRTVVVTADAPSPVAQLAVDELLHHFRLATGVELETITESEADADSPYSRIFIGATVAAGAAGLPVDELEPDAFILRTDGSDLFIVGRENDEEYHQRSGLNGTLYGTYEFLERFLGVRWLWPGDLGTYVPRHQTVRVMPTDETVTMTMLYRDFWINHIHRQVREYQPHIERLAFTREGLDHYHQELQLFMRRHRLGWSRTKPWYPHQALARNHFDNHPEWFAMNQEGERTGPNMCVTNQELHQFHTDPQPGCCEGIFDYRDLKIINLEEADHRSYCHCEDCLAWDEPQPEDWPLHITSNRYARYAAVVRDLALEKHPELKDDNFVVTFLPYMDRTHAPTIDIDLTGVHLVFCPWYSGFNPNYPKPETEHQLFMDTWDGWLKTGASMHYRPNYLLFGYVMPHLSTWQTGEMLRHLADNGSLGVDFDSLHAHWAAKGPMLYMHLRMAAKAEMPITEVRNEYFSAFGPAAGKVEEYFDYWEEYSAEQAPGGGVCRTLPWQAGQLYPPASFEPAVRLLDQAMSLAREHDNGEYADRVAYLQAGLEHARLAAALMANLGARGGVPGTREKFIAARAALHELIEFRRDHEHLLISDYIAAAGGENRGLGDTIDRLLADDFEPIADAATAADMDQPWDTWHFRKDPDNIGVEQEWYVPDLIRSHKGLRVYDHDGRSFDLDRDLWTPVRVPSHLGQTSIGEYLGYGWYAVTFTAPEAWRDRPVELHFEGVDEQAWIYVNGEYVGEHTVESEDLAVGDLWDRAFSVVAPAGLITPGEQNLMVVRKHSSAGASGIWLPVGAQAGE